MSLAYVEKGAVIISDDGVEVKYHPKCPHCEHVEIGTTCRATVRHGIVNAGGFNCSRCLTGYSVVIRRDC